MIYISIDGDDIGRRITALYIRNDAAALSAFVGVVQHKVDRLAAFLQAAGFAIIFSAADGVVAERPTPPADIDDMFGAIRDISGSELTFSAGIGNSLRDAYVALLAAKSTGKNRLCCYWDIG